MGDERTVTKLVNIEFIWEKVHVANLPPFTDGFCKYVFDTFPHSGNDHGNNTLLHLLSRWGQRTSSPSTPSTLWGPGTLGSQFCLSSTIIEFSVFQVEGITIANSAYHSLMLINSYQPEDPTCELNFPKSYHKFQHQHQYCLYIYQHSYQKLITTLRYPMGENIYLASKRGRNQPFWERLGWRLLHQVIKNVPIPVGRTNNFQNFRTQDDSIYVNGHGIRWSSMAIVTSRRVVFWNDANGSAFVLSPVGSEGLEKHPLVVEDCTVIILIVILRIRWLGQHHHCHHQWFDMSRIRMSLRIAYSHLKS